VVKYSKRTGQPGWGECDEGFEICSSSENVFFRMRLEDCTWEAFEYIKKPLCELF
jgi:hypothetical protein